MFKQITLPYSFDSLEPYIDTLTMETHYGKHHAAYTNALNDAAQKAGISNMPIEELLSSLDKISDENLRRVICNNGGGFYNHNLYFSIMSPTPLKEPESELKAAIKKAFGDLASLKDALKNAAVGRFGSGWAWLVSDKSGVLSVTSSPNQDNPFSEGSDSVPILGIDVWEHAYYLKYKNLRGDYINGFFEVLDWRAVGENYKKLL